MSGDLQHIALNGTTDYIAALDTLCGLAQHNLVIFEKDFDDLGFNSEARHDILGLGPGGDHDHRDEGERGIRLNMPAPSDAILPAPAELAAPVQPQHAYLPDSPAPATPVRSLCCSGRGTLCTPLPF